MGIRVRRIGRSIGRAFRRVERFVRKTFDVFDPLVDLDGSRQKQMLNAYMQAEKEKMDRLEAREKEALEQAKNNAKYQDRVAKDRQRVGDRNFERRMGENIVSELGSQGVQAGGLTLDDRIKFAKILEKANKQSNTPVELDDEEKKKLLEFIKKHNENK